MLPNIENIAAAFLVKDKKIFVCRRNSSKCQNQQWELFSKNLKDENDSFDSVLKAEFDKEFHIKINVVSEVGSIEVEETNKVLIVMYFIIEGDFSSLTIDNNNKFVSKSELQTLALCTADKKLIEIFADVVNQYIS